MPNPGDSRTTLRGIFAEVMDALDLESALDRRAGEVERFLRQDPGHGVVRLIAFGKAAVPMARWFVARWGAAMEAGVVVAPVCEGVSPGLRAFEGGHPVPDAGSLRAGRAALDLAATAASDQGLVFLVSGGGSALLELPVHSTLGLEDLRAVHHALVTCGADIVDMNVVRKHLSAVKGGRLARAAAPARQLTLYVSDVPAGAESSVASGPTMPDPSTLSDFRAVLDRHDLPRRFPPAVRAILHELPETPKPGDACFDASRWVCVMDNGNAVEAAVRAGRGRGWQVEVDLSVDDMGVEEAAGRLLERLRAMRVRADGPVCIVSGGELSSPVHGDGVGGRNQAFVLECARRMAGERVAVLSAGTDGIDGNSPAAGAVADGGTIDRGLALGMDADAYAERSDAHSFFARLGDAIVCGPTGNNVRDVRVLIAWP